MGLNPLARRIRQKIFARALPALTLGLSLILLILAVQLDRLWFERHVFRLYCVASTADEAILFVTRAGLVAGAFALWCWVRPWSSQLALRITVRDFASCSLQVTAALSAAVVATELILRIAGVGAWPRERADLPRDRRDARYGWIYPTQIKRVVEAGRAVDYVIGREGTRVRSPSDRLDPSRPTLIVTGESTAFGFGLPWQETFAAEVGAAFDLQVVNLALPGWGNDQAYLRLVDALPNFSDVRAVVTVFLPHQILRNQTRYRPHLTLDNNGILTLVTPSAADLRLAMLFEEEPYHSSAPLEVMRAILRSTADLARAHGALPLFLVTNYGESCRCETGQHEPWVVRELFDRERLSYVHVDVRPAEYLEPPNDRHPNPAASHRIAQALIEALQRNRLGAKRAARTP